MSTRVIAGPISPPPWTAGSTWGLPTGAHAWTGITSVTVDSEKITLHYAASSKVITMCVTIDDAFARDVDDWFVGCSAGLAVSYLYLAKTVRTYSPDGTLLDVTKVPVDPTGTVWPDHCALFVNGLVQN